MLFMFYFALTNFVQNHTITLCQLFGLLILQWPLAKPKHNNMLIQTAREICQNIYCSGNYCLSLSLSIFLFLLKIKGILFSHSLSFHKVNFS